MDNKFRFGRIEVSCEGYSEPNDPYVLRGSCGVCIQYLQDFYKLMTILTLRFFLLLIYS